MIDSIITTNKPNKSTTPLYPYIGKANLNIKPFWVLFTSTDTGTVISSNNKGINIGYYSEDWEEKKEFTKDDSITITLTNKP